MTAATAVAERPAPIGLACPLCDGTGREPWDDTPCAKCGGTGVQRARHALPPDRHSWDFKHWYTRLAGYADWFADFCRLRRAAREGWHFGLSADGALMVSRVGGSGRYRIGASCCACPARKPDCAHRQALDGYFSDYEDCSRAYRTALRAVTAAAEEGAA